MSEPANADALSAKRDILQWSKEKSPVSTAVRTGYSFDTFTKPYNRYWQVFNAGMLNTILTGDWQQPELISVMPLLVSQFLITLLNGSLKFEAYPKLSGKNYAYLAYAFSPGAYFPGHRAAVEIWQVLPAGWAASAGVKLLF